jgi:sulfatase modifying factor 1
MHPLLCVLCGKSYVLLIDAEIPRVTPAAAAERSASRGHSCGMIDVIIENHNDNERNASRHFRNSAVILEFPMGFPHTDMASRRSTAIRQVSRWPRRPSDFDRWPGWLLLLLGLLPGLALGWLAIQSTIATGLLILLLIPAAGRAGWRPRLVWDEHSLPVGLQPDSDGGQSLPESPTPPYPIQDQMIELMALPAGRFWMGSDQRLDPDSYADERPRHRVRLSAFAIARRPVTRGLYRQVMSDAPSSWSTDDSDDDLPANALDWEQALLCCNALSVQAGLQPCYRRRLWRWVCNWRASGYRLPTEAEWEYACRAGTESRWFWGDYASKADTFAWFNANSDGKPHPVGEKAPNPWGLFDMSGNVWEWCWDRWQGHYLLAGRRNPHGPLLGVGRRVLRGGSFVLQPRYLRSAARLWDLPEGRLALIGFRCVRGSVRQHDH